MLSEYIIILQAGGNKDSCKVDWQTEEIAFRGNSPSCGISGFLVYYVLLSLAVTGWLKLIKKNPPKVGKRRW